MIYTPMTKVALRMCFDAHKDQVDKSGMPYVFHPFHLAEQMTTEDEVCVALLHDVMEDTDATADDLRSAGFPEHVIEALLLLTHEDGVSYEDYVRPIKENQLARVVKLADLHHNSDTSRLDEVTPGALAREARYAKAIAFLES